jgi:hypothetical protein
MAETNGYHPLLVLDLTRSQRLNAPYRWYLYLLPKLRSLSPVESSSAPSLAPINRKKGSIL